MVQWLNVLAVDKAEIEARVQTPPQLVEIEMNQQKDCVWARGRPIIDIGHFQNRFADLFFFYIYNANKHTIYRWYYLLVNK